MAEGSRRSAITAAQRALLDISRERDTWLRRVLRAERAGYRRGYRAGVAAGYRQSEAELAAAWYAVAHPVAQPEAYRRECAQRNLRLAEAGTRRDADEQERAFVGRAYATRQDQRTEVQRATVFLYAPIGAKR